MSADGRYVAFISWASNQVPGDTNGADDVFVRDRRKGTTTRVNVSSTGAQADGVDNGFGSETVAISADGRYVTYSSRSTNLVPNDTNGSEDVFVYDRRTAITTRVSLTSTGEQTYAVDSSEPSISAHGRYVAFASPSQAAVLHDRRDGTTTQLAVISSDFSEGPVISANGRYVAFADNSVVQPDHHFWTTDIFLIDRYGRS